MLKFSKIIFCFCTFITCSLMASELEVLTANQYRNIRNVPVGSEGNKAILAVREMLKNKKVAGAFIQITFKNNSNSEKTLTGSH